MGCFLLDRAPVKVQAGKGIGISEVWVKFKVVGLGGRTAGRTAQKKGTNLQKTLVAALLPYWDQHG